MSRSHIVKGALISYVSIFLNIIIALVYTPWMIHKIGVSDYGLYSLTSAFLSYFLLDFGLTDTITRFIATYRAEGNKKKIENMLGLTAKIYFAFDTIIFVVLFVLYFFISNIFGGLTLEEIERLKVLYCIAGTFSILSFALKPVSGAMMAYEYFVQNKLLDMLVRVGTVLLIIIVLLWDGNVFHLVFITGFVSFTISVTKYLYFTNKSKLNVNWKYFDEGELKILFSYSVWVLLVQLAQLFRLNLVPAILGIVSNTTEISVFSVGRNLEGFIYNISMALGGLFLPMVSRLSYNNKNNRKSIMELMIKVGRIQLFIISLIFSGFCIYGDSFINLWVGEEFHDAYYVFVFLVFVNLLSLTMHIGMDLIYAENKIRHTAMRVFISSFIGIVLSFIVAPKYGAIGCAAATGFALVLTQILYVQFFNDKMGLDMKFFFKCCHVRILPLIILYTVFAFFISRLYYIDNWKILLFSISTYTIGFILMCYFILMNNDERNIVRGLVHKSH